MAAWQSGKFAARLQAVNSSDKPILFWVDFERGHGAGDKIDILSSENSLQIRSLITEMYGE